MKSMTTLGLGERLERVLAYAFGWLSGLLLFIFEKNRSVRWHAVQSMITFGAMSLLMLIVSVLRGFLHMIPLLNLLTDAGLGLLLSIFWWVTVGLWLWLMIWPGSNPTIVCRLSANLCGTGYDVVFYERLLKPACMPIPTSPPQSVAMKFTTSLSIQGQPRKNTVLVPQRWIRRSVSLLQTGQ